MFWIWTTEQKMSQQVHSSNMCFGRLWPTSFSFLAISSAGEAPIDFMLRGYLGSEPIGLELIDGYFLRELKLEQLGFSRRMSAWCHVNEFFSLDSLLPTFCRVWCNSCLKVTSLAAKPLVLLIVEAPRAHTLISTNSRTRHILMRWKLGVNPCEHYMSGSAWVTGL